MNKSEFIAIIAEKTQLSKAQTEMVCKTLFDTISDIMTKQDKILIPGFGSFSAKKRAARKGRNPSTGKEILIAESTVANFKAAQQLKELMNQ